MYLRGVVMMRSLGSDKSAGFRMPQAVRAWTQALLQAIPDMLFRITREGVALDFKPAMDFPPLVAEKEFLGKPLGSVLPPPLAALLKETTEKAFSTRQLQTIEYEIELEGRTRAYEARMMPSSPLEALLLVRDITERKQTEERLRATDEQQRRLTERLMTLYEVNNSLSRAETLEDLLRQSVVLGRSQLGFDRMSVWLTGPDGSYLEGTFGTDEQGRPRDERGCRIRTNAPIAESLKPSAPSSAIREECANLHNHHLAVVGRGSSAWVPIWDGQNNIGLLMIDNLIHGQPITDEDCRLLCLYASMLGHLHARKKMEQELRRSEQRYRLLADHCSDTITVHTADNTLSYVSPAVRGLLGYQPEEVLGSCGFDFLHPDDIERIATEIRDLIDGKVATVSVEYRLRRRDGRYVWVESQGRLLKETQVPGLNGILNVTRDTTARKLAEAQRLGHLEQIRQLTADTGKTLERERARISRELHDELGGLLTALNMNLAWLGDREFSDQSGIRNHLAEAREYVRQITASVRHLSKSLRPPVLDHQGLVAAVRSYAADFQERTGVHCEVSASPDDLSVNDPAATVVFRVVQEALTNVARHAGTRWCEVSLEEASSELTVRIQDYGVGAGPDALAGKLSLGIIGMRERVALLNGSLHIESEPGSGFCVTARLPLQDHVESERTS
ncbi:MAG: PAS domain S-box protein [Phycisphaerae bacterium]|nr:PAS domain S-box protein [Phycisphaerae bacterium]